MNRRKRCVWVCACVYGSIIFLPIVQFNCLIHNGFKYMYYENYNVMLFFTIQHQIKGIKKLKILKGIVCKHTCVGAFLCNPKPDRLTNCYSQILSKCVHKQYAKYSWKIFLIWSSMKNSRFQTLLRYYFHKVCV